MPILNVYQNFDGFLVKVVVINRRLVRILDQSDSNNRTFELKKISSDLAASLKRWFSDTGSLNGVKPVVIYFENGKVERTFLSAEEIVALSRHKDIKNLAFDSVIE